MQYVNQANIYLGSMYEGACKQAKNHYNEMPDNILDSVEKGILISAGLTAIMSGFAVGTIITAAAASATATLVSAAVQPIFNKFAQSTGYSKLTFTAQQIAVFTLISTTGAMLSIPVGPVIATSLAFNIAFALTVECLGHDYTFPYIFGA